MERLESERESERPAEGQVALTVFLTVDRREHSARVNCLEAGGGTDTCSSEQVRRCAQQERRSDQMQRFR